MTGNIADTLELSSFHCEVCGCERLAILIDVFKLDISARYDLPFGTAWRNINYCSGSAECWLGAGEIAERFLAEHGASV